MASYRSVYTTFWTDTKVSDDFTPEDKYFMLYCLTNNYTNLCGCYEISIKQMAIDTGYNEETIKKLLKRFNSIHKIIFYNEGNKELLIKNWYKYNWTKSNKLDKPLLNEIQKIKTIEFKKIVADEYNKRNCRYIQGILNSWINKGYKVVADIQKEQEEKENVKGNEEHQETKEERIARLKKEWGIEDED